MKYQYETLSPWGSSDSGFEIGLKIIPSGLSGGGKKISLKNEDVMRKLAPHSCDVMSKRYSKKVEVPSALPLQLADYIKSIKTKQENFELKLEQGRVNFQHILETLEVRVQRVQCHVKHYMAFDLQVQTERLLHKNPVSTKHCEL